MIATVIYVTSGLIAITAIAMIVIGVWIYFRHAGQYFVFLIRNILCSRCETIGAARVFGCGCPVVRLSIVKFKITFNFLLQVLRLLHCTLLSTLIVAKLSSIVYVTVRNVHCTPVVSLIKNICGIGDPSCFASAAIFCEAYQKNSNLTLNPCSMPIMHTRNSSMTMS